MKVCSLLLTLCLLLCGCAAAPVWETVDDVLPSEPVAAWTQDAYTIYVDLPESLTLLEERDGCSVYGTADGGCEVETDRFLASGLDSAVRYLSGYDADRLLIIQTTRFGLPEYQFAWYAETDEGGRLCQADLVMDGTACYAVVCSGAETAGRTYRENCKQVFSSFGLYQDEGV